MRTVCDDTHLALQRLARWAKDGTLMEVARHHRDSPPGGGMLLEPLRSGGAVAVIRSETGGEPLALALAGGLDGVPEAGELTELKPADDEHLPGAGLLREVERIGELAAGRMREVERCEVVAYHPERRCVVRVSGVGSDGAARKLYLKLFSAKSFRRSIRRLDELGPSGDLAGTLGLSLPVASDRERAAMLFEAAPGRSLHDLQAERAPVDSAPIVEALGSWCATAAPDGLPRRDLETERQSALAMLEQSRSIIPALGQLKVFVEAIELTAESGDGLAHGDLHDKQLFVAEGRITLIDLDQVARGPRYFDIVNLSEHLLFRAFQNLGFLEDLDASLCRHFLDEVDPRRVRLLRGLTRARLAGVYARRPEWHALVPLLIARAAEVLTEEL